MAHIAWLEVQAVLNDNWMACCAKGTAYCKASHRFRFVAQLMGATCPSLFLDVPIDGDLDSMQNDA